MKEKGDSSSKRFRQFEQEERRSRIVHIVEYTAVLIAGAFLILFLAGDYTYGFLEHFGINPLRNPKRGVYADCSRPENRDNDFCSSTNERVESRWRSIEQKNSRPFAIP